jgi:hypothetical protein
MSTLRSNKQYSYYNALDTPLAIELYATQQN